MTNAHEPPWQNVKEESPDKFLRLQSHDVEFVTPAGITPLEGNLAILERHEAVVADGDAVGVAPEVVHDVSGRAKGGLGIDHPILLEE
jgi:hypothetical protein